VKSEERLGSTCFNQGPFGFFVLEQESDREVCVGGKVFSEDAKTQVVLTAKKSKTQRGVRGGDRQGMGGS